jgi:hypothetical protein
MDWRCWGVSGEGRFSIFLGVEGGWRFGLGGLDGEFVEVGCVLASGGLEGELAYFDDVLGSGDFAGECLDVVCVFVSGILDCELVGVALRTEDAVARAYDGGAMAGRSTRSVRLVVFVFHCMI